MGQNRLFHVSVGVSWTGVIVSVCIEPYHTHHSIMKYIVLIHGIVLCAWCFYVQMISMLHLRSLVSGQMLSLPKMAPSGKCNVVTDVWKLAKIEVPKSQKLIVVRKISS